MIGENARRLRLRRGWPGGIENVAGEPAVHPARDGVLKLFVQVLVDEIVVTLV